MSDSTIASKLLRRGYAGPAVFLSVSVGRERRRTVVSSGDLDDKRIKST
jgi:hypothetical protein